MIPFYRFGTVRDDWFVLRYSVTILRPRHHSFYHILHSILIRVPLPFYLFVLFILFYISIHSSWFRWYILIISCSIRCLIGTIHSVCYSCSIHSLTDTFCSIPMMHFILKLHSCSAIPWYSFIVPCCCLVMRLPPCISITVPTYIRCCCHSLPSPTTIVLIRCCSTYIYIPDTIFIRYIPVCSLIDSGRYSDIRPYDRPHHSILRWLTLRWCYHHLLTDCSWPTIVPREVMHSLMLTFGDWYSTGRYLRPTFRPFYSIRPTFCLKIHLTFYWPFCSTFHWHSWYRYRYIPGTTDWHYLPLTFWPCSYRYRPYRSVLIFLH